MTYRASLEWLENTCDAEYDDLETTLVDVVPDGEGTHDIRFRPWDVRWGPLHAGIEIRDGKVDFRTVNTSPRGRGSLHQGIRGRLTRDAIDLTVTGLDDAVDIPAAGGICVRRYRLRGAARLYGDPAALDGMYRGTYVAYAESCDGGETAEAYRARLPLYAGPSGHGEVALQMGHLRLFIVPDPGAEPFGWSGEAIVLRGSGGYPMQGKLSGIATPASVDLRGEVFFDGKDGKRCRYPVAYSGAKIAPYAQGFDNEYRVRKTLADSCAHSDPPEPWTDLVDVVVQEDGSILLLDGMRTVPATLEDGAFSASASGRDGYETMTYSGRLDPPRLSFTVEHVTRYGRECVKTTVAEGSARFAY
jgi:hypothetical protein